MNKLNQFKILKMSQASHFSFLLIVALATSGIPSSGLTATKTELQIKEPSISPSTTLHTRTNVITSAKEILISKLKKENQSKAYLLSSHDFSSQDIQNIYEQVRNRDFHYQKQNDFWIFGSGTSYFLLRDLFQEAQKITDPKIKNIFLRLVEYQSKNLIPIENRYLQATTAFFSPDSKKLTFAMPSRSDVPIYSHEMTHAKFQDFTLQLERWLKAKNDLVPFQIDGPRLEGIAGLMSGSRGGIYNLFNELNAWRTQRKMEGFQESRDEEILQNIISMYGPQSGFEAIEVFKKYWTLEKINSRFVGDIILDEIKSFNNLTLIEHLKNGQEGIQQNDLLKKMNFLIVFESKKFIHSDLEEKAKLVLQEMIQTSTEDLVQNKIQLFYPQLLSEKPNFSHAESKLHKVEESEFFLQNASLPEVLKVFNETGSSTSTDLLKGKFLNQITAENIETIVDRAFKPKSAFFVHEAIEVLYSLLQREKITQNIEKDGLKVSLRPQHKSEILRALDLSLSKRFYDGGVAGKKIELLNFISMFTLPEELPKTYQKTLNILQNESMQKKSDLWVARLFFMSADEERAGLDILWGEKLISDLKNFPREGALAEVIALFYQESMSHFIADDLVYGKDSQKKINALSRNETVKRFNNLEIEQKKRLRDAGRTLWFLLGSQDLRVQKAAKYALISNPLYIWVNAENIKKAYQAKDPQYLSILSFIFEVTGELIPLPKI